jgi:hypothetical protein
LLLAGPAWAGGSSQGKLLVDLWDAAYLQGAPAGNVHTTVRELNRDGGKILRATQELRLTVKRFNDTIQLRMETGTDETPAGKVVGVFMHQYLGTDKKLSITGTVVGKELRLVLDGKQPLKPAPWDDQVVGLYRQMRLFQQRDVKPGDQFSYLTFEPTVNLVVRTHVKVKGPEQVELFGGTKENRLLRVELRPEKIEKVQLPTMVTWLDDDLRPVRSQAEVPGLGQMTLYRTTREGAQKRGQVASLTDIGIGNFIPLKRRIAQPYATRQMVYRITVKGDEDPTTTFFKDERQQVKNARGNTFELDVDASRGTGAVEEGKSPGDEFLQSSYFITSADARVRQLAQQAVGKETDPWKKAIRVVRWVHNHMRSTSDQALATADHVARTLQGDCTEYAMLAAAMCRAGGVPSRTAIGLIYADTRDRGPVFAFHMWTEVWVKGQWLPLDATLPDPYVGATHLKITEHSWHEIRSMTPLLPVLRVLGKVSIEVVDGR